MKSPSGSTNNSSQADEIQIDRSAFNENGNSQQALSLQKMKHARESEQKLKEIIPKAFKLIEGDNEEGLKKLLNDNRDVPVDEILDSRGYSLLHEATFQDSTKLVRVLIRHGRMTLKPPKLSDWIDAKTHNDGFSALHFASFKGNPDSCELLIDNGADIYARNNFGINMVHVAAQGD